VGRCSFCVVEEVGCERFFRRSEVALLRDGALLCSLASLHRHFLQAGESCVVTGNVECPSCGAVARRVNI